MEISKKNQKQFQSYVLVGEKIDTERELTSMLMALGINPEKQLLDITRIAPEKKTISISKVRDLKRNIFQKPLKLKHKIIIIEEADCLTPEAQNALLKIFEEPPTHAIIILNARNPKNILPTIISRAVIRSLSSQKEPGETQIPVSFKEAFLGLNEIEDPNAYIDRLLADYFDKLKKQVKQGQAVEQHLQVIEKIKQAKLMLEANVNPKHVIADILLYIEEHKNSASSNLA